MKLLLLMLGLCRRSRWHWNTRRGPKLSVVRILQWQAWRRRYKLRVHNVSTMFGHRERDRRLLPTEYAISASTGAAFIEAAPPVSLLNASCSAIGLRMRRNSSRLIFAEQLGRAESRKVHRDPARLMTRGLFSDLAGTINSAQTFLC